jgi:uncharacterized integral membrane protein
MRSPLVVLVALLAVIGGLLLLQLPEIRRYLKIRAM